MFDFLIGGGLDFRKGTLQMMGTMLVTESFRIEDCKTFDEAKKQTLEFYKDICKVVQKITKENENGCNR